MTFIELCRKHNLSEPEARSCARFLTFIRSEKVALALTRIIDQEYKNSPKARKVKAEREKG